MITVMIPGRDRLDIEHVVLDYNGTIAVDGKLKEGVRERIAKLLPNVSVHVLTADTYGTVEAQCAPLGIRVEKFPREGAAQCKLEVVKALGDGVCAFGNGYNDEAMFGQAALSVAVLEGEGMYPGLLACADVLVKAIEDGLDLLLMPDRLRATLRS